MAVSKPDWDSQTTPPRLGGNPSEAVFAYANLELNFSIRIFIFAEDSYSVHVEMENEDVELQITDTAGEVCICRTLHDMRQV